MRFGIHQGKGRGPHDTYSARHCQGDCLPTSRLLLHVCARDIMWVVHQNNFNTSKVTIFLTYGIRRHYHLPNGQFCAEDWKFCVSKQKIAQESNFAIRASSIHVCKGIISLCEALGGLITDWLDWETETSTICSDNQKTGKRSESSRRRKLSSHTFDLHLLLQIKDVWKLNMFSFQTFNQSWKIIFCDFERSDEPLVKISEERLFIHVGKHSCKAVPP